jgi:hypothetical protein
MIDYLAVALSGFSTGMGVICAQEVYQWLKKYRNNIKHNVQKMVEENNIFNRKL